MARIKGIHYLINYNFFNLKKRNMRLVLNMLIFCLVIGSLQSCVSKKKFDEMQAEKEATEQSLAETQAKVAQLQEQNSELESTLESEKERLNSDISDLRSDLNSTQSQMAQVQEKLNMTEQQLNELKSDINGMFAAYENSGLTMEEREGRLYVVTSQPVRYRSGSARLSSDERKALAELAETLKNNPDVKIMVEGHTDTDKMLPDAPWKDNWDLSLDRAMVVVRELLKNGVSPDQVSAAGRGEYMPIAPNDNAEGKAENRRTVVRPDVSVDHLRSGGNN